MHALIGNRCRAVAMACALSLSMVACNGGSSSASTDSGAGGESANGGNAQTGGGSAQTGGSSTGPGKLSTASATVARRLSRTELSNLVRDVLGDESSAPAKFLSEDQYRPFDNDYTVQSACSARGAAGQSRQDRALHTDGTGRRRVPAQHDREHWAALISQAVERRAGAGLFNATELCDRERPKRA